MGYEIEKSKVTYEVARRELEGANFDIMKGIKLVDAVTEYLRGIESDNTRRAYANHLNQLFKVGLLDESITLAQFALSNINAVLDHIKQLPKLAESTKQARAACYISFTKFLDRRSNGIVRRAVPESTGMTKTFFKVRDKCSTAALTKKQRDKFFKQLGNINSRDLLIAKIILQGGKRKQEVLSAQVGDINWRKKQIRFKQSKTKGVDSYTVITYSSEIMKELKKYIAGRDSGLIFVTSRGNKIRATQINRNFKLAGERANIKFTVTPHTLRATAVTLLSRDYAPHEVMKVTGHKTMSQVQSYDKSSAADNPTRDVDLCR